MSSTRLAKDGAFHQSRFASSPEFHHGLSANLVAARTSKIESAANRELVWFIQFLSHPHLSGISDGLTGVAADILAKYGHRLGTTSMVKADKKAGENYTAEEVREIRVEMPGRVEALYPLRGELAEFDKLSYQLGRMAAGYRLLEAQKRMQGYEASTSDSQGQSAPEELRLAEAECEKIEADKRAALEKFPDTYPVQAFLTHCREAAEYGGKAGGDSVSLEKELARMCLDPACALDRGPWYFRELLDVLRDYKKQWTTGKTVVETSVVKAIAEMLDYTMHSMGLTLLTGPSNVGARFAAREMCRQNPGRLRFCEVPATNDEAGFLKAVARSLGGNLTNYKNSQIRERVEAVLQSGDLVLVLCGAQNLWPVLNLRESFPRRLAWLIDQTERGAGVCMISSPQFFMQKRTCEKTGWDSPEFLSKISEAAALPESLTMEELTEIAGVALPAASADDRDTMALTAVGSTKFLANIQQVSDKAKYIAEKGGRIELTAEDINEAITAVDRSDALLRAATTVSKKPARGGNAAGSKKPLSSSVKSSKPSGTARNAAPAAVPSPHRAVIPQRINLTAVTPE